MSNRPILPEVRVSLKNPYFKEKTHPIDFREDVRIYDYVVTDLEKRLIAKKTASRFGM